MVGPEATDKVCILITGAAQKAKAIARLIKINQTDRIENGNYKPGTDPDDIEQHQRCHQSAAGWETCLIFSVPRLPEYINFVRKNIQI
jgi:hypothetical protein